MMSNETPSVPTDALKPEPPSNTGQEPAIANNNNSSTNEDSNKSPDPNSTSGGNGNGGTEDSDEQELLDLENQVLEDRREDAEAESELKDVKVLFAQKLLKFQLKRTKKIQSEAALSLLKAKILSKKEHKLAMQNQADDHDAAMKSAMKKKDEERESTVTKLGSVHEQEKTDMRTGYENALNQAEETYRSELASKDADIQKLKGKVQKYKEYCKESEDRRKSYDAKRRPVPDDSDDDGAGPGVGGGPAIS